MYDKHKNDDLMTRFHTEQIHDKVINNMFITDNNEEWHKEAKERNDRLSSTKHRFMDENGN